MYTLIKKKYYFYLVNVTEQKTEYFDFDQTQIKHR